MSLFGFKIEGINSATIGNTGAVDPNDLSLADPGAEPFKQTVTIGESEWSNINQENNTYNADLKNSFVIQVQGSENDSITGYIDNIAMVRVFAIGEHDADGRGLLDRCREAVEEKAIGILELHLKPAPHPHILIGTPWGGSPWRPHR